MEKRIGIISSRLKVLRYSARVGLCSFCKYIAPIPFSELMASCSVWMRSVDSFTSRRNCFSCSCRTASSWSACCRFDWTSCSSFKRSSSSVLDSAISFWCWSISLFRTSKFCWAWANRVCLSSSLHRTCAFHIHVLPILFFRCDFSCHLLQGSFLAAVRTV